MKSNRNSKKGRGALLASVFALTMAAGITGATYSGITKEASVDETCAHVTWPLIPAYCLDGASERTVRIVSADRMELNSLGERFEVAFQ
jgi:hypothetical protein